MNLREAEDKQAKLVVLTRNFSSLAEFVAQFRPDSKTNAQINIRGYEDKISSEIRTARLYPETCGVLAELRSRKLKIGVISNLACPYKQPFFELRLDQLVDNVVFSCGAGIKKPNPEIYKIALADLQAMPYEALMCGDNAVCDVEAPKSVGMKAVLLDRNGCSENSDRISSLDEIFRYL